MRAMAATLLVLAVTMGGCIRAPGECRIDAAVRKPADRVVVSQGAARWLVDVTSESGIGEGTLHRVDDFWPSRITIRLPLWCLESFAMSNGALRFRTWQGQQSPVVLHRVRSEGAAEAQGAVRVPLRRVEKAFEVDVPHEMFEGNPASIKFNWVDVYRG